MAVTRAMNYATKAVKRSDKLSALQRLSLNSYSFAVPFTGEKLQVKGAPAIECRTGTRLLYHFD